MAAMETATPDYSDACVVLATYNEALNLEKLLPIILATLPGALVIVVDDNSPDGSPQLLTRMAAENPRLRPMIRPGKQGYGTAVLAGFSQALELGAQRIATLDADFSHDPAELPNLLGALDEADVSI